MARAARIALDLALVSLRTLSPVVSNIWTATKGLLINTRAKPFICHPFIAKAESALGRIAEIMVTKMTQLRDHQYSGEVKYLERELEKAKQRRDGKVDTASKSIKPACEIIWQYAKVEMIPPNTQSFFHGPAGKKLEKAVSKAADRFIEGLEGRIREIEAEKIRQIKAKEAAIKAAHDRAIAEAKRKEEQRLKEEAAKKALEAKKAKEKADEEKALKAKKEAEVKAAAKTDPKTKKPEPPKKPKQKKK